MLAFAVELGHFADAPPCWALRHWCRFRPFLLRLRRSRAPLDIAPGCRLGLPPRQAQTALNAGRSCRLGLPAHRPTSQGAHSKEKSRNPTAFLSQLRPSPRWASAPVGEVPWKPTNQGDLSVRVKR